MCSEVQTYFLTPLVEHFGRWFTMKSYPSFQRQLNFYCFQRIASGLDKGGYFHSLFNRGNRGLSYLIKRQRLKGEGPRKSDSSKNVPDFYSVPSCARNPPSPRMEPPSMLPHNHMQSTFSDTNISDEDITTPAMVMLPLPVQQCHQTIESTQDGRFNPNIYAFGSSPGDSQEIESCRYPSRNDKQ